MAKICLRCRKGPSGTDLVTCPSCGAVLVEADRIEGIPDPTSSTASGGSPPQPIPPVVGVALENPPTVEPEMDPPQSAPPLASQLNPAQLHPAQLNSPQLNRSQLDSSQGDSSHLDSSILQSTAHVADQQPEAAQWAEPEDPEAPMQLDYSGFVVGAQPESPEEPSVDAPVPGTLADYEAAGFEICVKHGAVGKYHCVDCGVPLCIQCQRYIINTRPWCYQCGLAVDEDQPSVFAVVTTNLGKVAVLLAIMIVVMGFIIKMVGFTLMALIVPAALGSLVARFVLFKDKVSQVDIRLIEPGHPDD